jgi:hypothetical protein
MGAGNLLIALFTAGVGRESSVPVHARSAWRILFQAANAPSHRELGPAAIPIAAVPDVRMAMRRLRTGVPHARTTEMSPSRMIAPGSLRIVIDGSDSVAVFVKDAESIARELLHRSRTKSCHGFARPRSNVPEGPVQF